jgi:hypothetical protein
VGDGEGVNSDLMFSILLMKNLRNSSQVAVDTSAAGELTGLITELIVLNKMFGLFECLLIKSERCFALAFFAAVWKAAKAVLKNSKETVR